MTSPSSRHDKQTGSDVHGIQAYTYANAAARTGATGFTAGDPGKIALQTDTNTLWFLLDTTPTWLQIQTGLSSTGAGEVSASYLTLNATSSLVGERVLSVSGTSGLLASDNGSVLALSINNNTVATLTGSVFSGPVVAGGGLSGSLQRLSSGVPYLVSGPNITISTQSNGQVAVSGSTGADPGAAYLVISTTSSLPNERALVQGTGLLFVDGGAGTGLTVSINNNVVATLTGSLFTGVVSASAGLSGSLQQVGPGLPYLLSGRGINIVTQSNGQVIILNIAPGEISASYLTIGTTGSLPNERALIQGTGLIFVDGGAGTGLTASINNGVVATLTGSLFSGPVSASAGLSGSLQRVGPNLTYLVSSGSLTITSQSNGQVLLQTPQFAQNLFLSGTTVLQTPFHNSTTVLLSALAMTASSLVNGVYRLGWSYVWRSNTTTDSFKCEMFVGTTSSWQHQEIASNANPNQRRTESGVAFLVVSSSQMTFDLRCGLSSAATNTTASLYNRSIEFWRVL